MFRLWSRTEVCRHAGVARDWDGHAIELPVTSVAESDRIIDFFERMAAAGRGFRWAMVLGDTEEFVGAVGFNALAPTAELAFHLRPEFWGRGLMREAALAALMWLDPTRPVEAFIAPDNAASIGLAHRLGFVGTQQMVEGAERFMLRR